MALIGVFALANGATVILLDEGVQIRVNGNGNQVHTRTAEGAVPKSQFNGTPADLCLLPQAVITLAVNHHNQPEYHAKVELADARYDLTWQVGGSVVAVEELRGKDFVAWAGQADSKFWACVNAKPANRVEAH